MERTTLGKTGLEVSVMGLGCGGASRLGLAAGKTEQEAAGIVRKALALGVNFIDTAEAYGTEAVVGKALEGTPREQVVLSTKVGPRRKDHLLTAAELKERVAGCLDRLRTGYVDILHLHGVAAGDYSYVAAELVPALAGLRAQGKIRFLGITEAFGSDPQHTMLARALEDDHWDVVMAGFNLLNQSARERLLTRTLRNGTGVLCMFAVRRALSNPETLKTLVRDLAGRGLLDGSAFDLDDPLGFLLRDARAASIPDAAYRFCRYEPGIHVVLSGTGDAGHLEDNAASLGRPPLPQEVVERLKRLFQGVDSVSGN